MTFEEGSEVRARLTPGGKNLVSGPILELQDRSANIRVDAMLTDDGHPLTDARHQGAKIEIGSVIEVPVTSIVQVKPTE